LDENSVVNHSKSSVAIIDDTRANTLVPAETQVDSDITHTQKLQSLTDKGINIQQNSLTTEEFHKLADLGT